MPHSSVFYLTSVALVAALFFGGGTRHGLSSDVAPQLAAIPLLFLALRQLGSSVRRERVLWLAVALFVAIPVVQLIPMPPSLWSSLPGRGLAAEVQAAAGVSAGWRPMSLIPDATWRALLATLPGLAVFAGVSLLGVRAREKVVLLAVGVGLLSVFVALFQVAFGGGPYFYAITNEGRAVGFFANANHFAAFLYVMLMLSVAALARPHIKVPLPAVMTSGFAGVAFMLAMPLSGSRTALLLGVPAILVAAIAFRHFHLSTLSRHRFLAAVGVTLAVLFPIALGLGLMLIFDRLQNQDLLDDLRWPMAQTALDMARAVFPFGGGMGVLPSLYPSAEGERLVAVYVNRAHNDVLEFIYEGGALAIGVYLLFALWLAQKLRGIAREGFWSRGHLAGVAWVSILFLSLHSLWDYPMRTAALAALFGLCCALLTEPGAHEAGAWQGRHRRRRKRGATRASIAPKPV